jgi:hypothetical protein
MNCGLMWWQGLGLSHNGLAFSDFARVGSDPQYRIKWAVSDKSRDDWYDAKPAQIAEAKIRCQKGKANEGGSCNNSNNTINGSNIGEHEIVLSVLSQVGRPSLICW